jgi:hypothetical protein
MGGRTVAGHTRETDWMPDEAGRARIRDLDGGEHELRELWAKRPVVLVFVRHFG